MTHLTGKKSKYGIEPADRVVTRIFRDIQRAAHSESHPHAVRKIQRHGWARLIHYFLTTDQGERGYES